MSIIFEYYYYQVTPAAGILKPDQAADISIHHQEFHTLEEFVDGIPQSWWSEDTRDKEVILLVNVRGSCSIEMRSYQIHVHQRFSANVVHLDSKTNSRKHQGSSQQQGTSHQGSSQQGSTHHLRSTHRPGGAASSETIDEPRSLRGP